MLMILELIQAIESDEERELVERIYYLYYKQMIVKANSILHHQQDAEDAVMETFRLISENVKTFMNFEREDLAALVSIYTRNVALNMYKHKKKQREVFDINFDFNQENTVDCSACYQENPQTLVVNDETIHIVKNAIDQLNDRFKDVIVLKYYYHMRNVEIAGILSIEENTVNSHIYRAKNKLKEIIGKEGYERITY
ncbi:MAG: RNA polymerase sigma factor [Ruminococcaceae bacterium]|nr:RNA polymerase sigma factor [Oscillospiraceae bacterium]